MNERSEQCAVTSIFFFVTELEVLVQQIFHATGI